MIRRHLVPGIAALALIAIGTWGASARADGEASEALDPAHNVSLPCEAISTPGLVPRSAKNIVHVANVCGFVGTDIEFQSRTDAQGNVRDYAFVGTMGAGTRIFDVTDPEHPVWVGGFADPGWQNDVQVAGDVLVLGFDWLLVGANASTCLREKDPVRSADTAGIDIVRLDYDPQTGTFETHLAGCYLSSIDTAGAHTVTIHPSGEWLTVNTSWVGLEVVDIRGPEPKLVHFVPREVVDQAHDVSFSRDGNTLYSAGISSTRIVDVSDVFNRAPTLIGTVPNVASAEQGADGQNVAISHQSDTSSDGKIFLVTDEAGGGLNERRCNTSADGNIGGLHFWALAPLDGVAASDGASPEAPKKIGTWIYPNPELALDPLDPVLAGLGRTERACTIHVFRAGGNGGAGPGPAASGYDGVSRLPDRELVTAHYGAGVWHLDFSGPAGPDEDPRTTWGRTLGWNVMPGADTWSGKEYKGYVYAGDMARGFDVYAFGDCDGIECIALPVSTAGSASGGGKSADELAELSILSGTAPGGKATFSFDVSSTGSVATGSLMFRDHGLKKKVESTAIDSFQVAGNTAEITGRATVDGVPGVSFFVAVQDFGEPGDADTFRIVLGDGYGAGGVILNGNIEVEGGPLG